MLIEKLQAKGFFPDIFVSTFECEYPTEGRLSPVGDGEAQKLLVVGFPNGQVVLWDELKAQLEEVCGIQGTPTSHRGRFLTLFWTTKPNEKLSFPEALTFTSPPEEVPDTIDFDDGSVRELDEAAMLETAMLAGFFRRSLESQTPLKGRIYILGACFWSVKKLNSRRHGDPFQAFRGPGYGSAFLPKQLVFEGLYISPAFRELLVSLVFAVLSVGFAKGIVNPVPIQEYFNTCLRWKALCEEYWGPGFLLPEEADLTKIAEKSAFLCLKKKTGGPRHLALWAQFSPWFQFFQELLRSEEAVPVFVRNGLYPLYGTEAEIFLPSSFLSSLEEKDRRFLEIARSQCSSSENAFPLTPLAFLLRKKFLRSSFVPYPAEVFLIEKKERKVRGSVDYACRKSLIPVLASLFPFKGKTSASVSRYTSKIVKRVKSLQDSFLQNNSEESTVETTQKTVERSL